MEETYKKFGAMEGSLGAPLGVGVGAAAAYRQTSSSALPSQQQHPMAGHNTAAYHPMAHAGVSQFAHGSVAGYCNGGLGNVGDLASYPDSVRSSTAASGWYGANPDPRYPTSKRGGAREGGTGSAGVGVLFAGGVEVCALKGIPYEALFGIMFFLKCLFPRLGRENPEFGDQFEWGKGELLQVFRESQGRKEGPLLS